ncbi:MAG: pyridoxine/pyridoxamine 5'-phosphate oxidase, partial [Solirubrobacterales bacterium]
MTEYEGSLRREDLAADPIEQFAAWFAEAQRSVPLADAMALGTADEKGAPTVRFVLLKAFGPEGMDFYSDYRSDKARQLEANPQAALALWWRELGRQVRVSGAVTRLDEAASDL